MKIHHINCLKIVSPLTDNVVGHCLLIENEGNLVLIDAGIGVLDTHLPQQRIGQELIDMVGFKFNEALTAYRQIEKLGLDPESVTDIVVSHLDPDHIGALVDFQTAAIHVSEEELSNFNSGNRRYLVHQLLHTTNVKTYGNSNETWYGFEARKVETACDLEIYLISLFGHTMGHCGVAINCGASWLFYVGDAYYLRVELHDETHPVNEMARLRADNDRLRMATLEKIKTLLMENPDIKVYAYHDADELAQYNVEVKLAEVAGK